MGEKRGQREAFGRTVKRVMDQGRKVGGEPREKVVREYLREKVAKVVETDRERGRKR